MTPRTRLSLPVTTLALLLAGAMAPQAAASGFQLREQSASAQGNAFAGISAGGADISGMFFNPASLTAFDGFQVVLGGSNVAPKAELGNAKGSRTALTGGSTISGPTENGNSAQSAVLPGIYAMWSVSKDFKLGLSVNAPFGLVTEYDNTFVGRYHALKSDLKTVDVALNAAYRVTPKLSVGATLIYRKVEAELSNAVDFGEIAFLGLSQAGSPAAASFNPNTTNSAFDGKATIKGDKAVTGYKLGLTFEPVPGVRTGLAYQGATTVKIDGTVNYQYPTIASPALAGAFNAVVAGGKLQNGTAATEITLPDTTSFGITWDVTSKVNLGFEAAQTGWSKFKELRVKFGSGQADSVTNENWKNTLYLSLGLNWKVTDALTLRAGLATDQGAVEDGYRTPRIPDADRTWMSVGMAYAFTKSFGIDLAYTHIAVKDGPVALVAGTSPSGPDFYRGNLTGTYKNSIEIMALQARFSF